MKNILIILVFLVSIINSMALSISFTEHTDSRLKFEVSGPPGSYAISQILPSTSARIFADLVGDEILFDLVWFLPVGAYNDQFSMSAITGEITDFGGHDITESNGIILFDYVAPFIVPELDGNPPWGVPDSGSSSALLLIGVAALAIGCTKTKIERKADGSWSINRSSLFQKLEELAGALCALIGVVWSIWEKRQNRRSGSGARLQDTPPPPPPTAGAVAAMILCGLALMLTTSGCSSMRGLATARIEIVSGTNRLLVVQPKDTVFKKLEFNPTTGAIEVTGYASAANAAAVAAQQAQTESIAASINQGIGQASTLAQQMMQAYSKGAAAAPPAEPAPVPPAPRPPAPKPQGPVAIIPGGTGATVATNGTWTLKGYSNDGGAATAATLLEAAVAGAVKGAK